jgi:hypothetical protein
LFELVLPHAEHNPIAGDAPTPSFANQDEARLYWSAIRELNAALRAIKDSLNDGWPGNCQKADMYEAAPELRRGVPVRAPVG